MSHSMGVLSIMCIVHVAGAVHVRVCMYCSLLHVCAYVGPLSHWLYGRETERYTKHCNANTMADSSRCQSIR